MIEQNSKIIKSSNNFDKDDEADKKKFKKKDISNPNSNTLSLHIAAYENTIETQSELMDDKIEEKANLNKQWKYVKQLFLGSSSVIQNPFEFPRQQENDATKTPELMQFKASQRLLTPNTPGNN
uniref:Uncharacterized protein n=1 Tax=Panagrolaimus sp. ES5 TaxID=591445 RepID=A0AC34G044_9BILA